MVLLNAFHHHNFLNVLDELNFQDRPAVRCVESKQQRRSGTTAEKPTNVTCSTMHTPRASEAKSHNKETEFAMEPP